MDTDRDVVLHYSLDIQADRLTREYPFGREAWGLKIIIKTILWVLVKTDVLKVTSNDTLS